MKTVLKSPLRVLVLAAVAWLCILSACSHRDPLVFTVVNWNVQTFFDAETAGNEYSQFRGASSPWSSDKYHTRVKRLCASIKELDGDILALEEIENQAVLHDIANELGAHLSRNKIYPYACFARPPGSSIGCGVLSRFPIDGLTVHSVDARSDREERPPSMRPLMELTLGMGEKAPPVVLFVAHWKSKVGGEDTADRWQRRQETVLARRLEQRLAGSGGERQPAILVCGDFNRDIVEFTPGTGDGTVLLDSSVEARSGWRTFDETVTGPGTYYFRGAWERIDHIFTAGACSLTSFTAPTGSWATSQDGALIPFRYQLNTGAGYSDHLPVRGTVVLTGNR
jgi:endonuclease/exonuclease/phosphatase family metal-dependent hydrolase